MFICWSIATVNLIVLHDEFQNTEHGNCKEIEGVNNKVNEIMEARDVKKVLKKTQAADGGG